MLPQSLNPLPIDSFERKLKIHRFPMLDGMPACCLSVVCCSSKHFCALVSGAQPTPVDAE
jgi:hypothetical protein